MSTREYPPISFIHTINQIFGNLSIAPTFGVFVISLLCVIFSFILYKQFKKNKNVSPNSKHKYKILCWIHFYSYVVWYLPVLYWFCFGTPAENPHDNLYAYLLIILFSCFYIPLMFIRLATISKMKKLDPIQHLHWNLPWVILWGIVINIGVISSLIFCLMRHSNKFIGGAVPVKDDYGDDEEDSELDETVHVLSDDSNQ